MAEEEPVRTQERTEAPSETNARDYASLASSRGGDPHDNTPHLVVPSPDRSSFWDDFWLTEVWYRIRPILIELTVHTLIFGMLFGSLMLFHYIIGHSGLPPSQVEVLDKVHFYGSISVLVIFTISFIIKAILMEARGNHND